MIFFSIGMIILTFVQELDSSLPTVEINEGILRGTKRKTWGGRSIIGFLGIPYAEPPIGSLRFKAPVPKNPWNDTLNADREHPSCPQKNMYFPGRGIYGNEDCLYLNVYSPKMLQKNLLPVIIYIHGGGYTADSANPNLFGPDILLDKDVILVTVNYRLGPLGFLSLEDQVMPGNNGLKDQNLALLWVKRNILHFGGDSQKLTIYGNSAGGASVYYHMVSPLSRNLLFAGVASSGIATAQWSLAQKGEAKRNAERLSQYLNCPTNNSYAILNCLRKVDAYDIVAQYEKYQKFPYDPILPFKPVVEPTTEDAFISEHPVDIIKSNNSAKIPFMNGITSEEGGLNAAAIYDDYTNIEHLNRNFEEAAALIFYYQRDRFTSEQIREIRKFYFKDKVLENSTKSELTNLLTDAVNYYPQRLMSELHAKYTDQPVYFYLFAYRGSISHSPLFGDPDHNYGVIHCDDLIYVLSNDLFKSYKPTQSDLQMNNIMTTLLYNFASTGNPTPELTELIPTRWEPIQKDSFQYYFIKDFNELRMEKNLYTERYEFWKKICSQ